MIRLPTEGEPAGQILDTMRALRQHDVNWHDGRAWSLVFHAGDDVSAFLKEAYTLFFSENGLNPTAFPSLKKFEAEVVAMTATLLGGDEAVAGNMTSGGTESILMAVKTARDWARAHKPDVQTPEIILPVTAHPAFEKAAQYFSLRTVHVPVQADFRANVEAARTAVTPDTILMVGSAPSYPQGVVDPITEMAAIAQEKGLLFHVDACVGGFMLPFVRRLGYPVPEFDFQVPGVTSISVDLHKYAYAAKGASVILYRDKALRRYQFFVYPDWPGGIYASPTMTGTRPGGAIAAAWAVMHYLGEAGYLAIADTVMKTTVKLREGINAIDGVRVLGDPTMSVLAIGSDSLNVYEIADELSARGWHLDRQQFPPSLHLTVTHAHHQVAEQFLADLAASVAEIKRFNLGRLAGSLQVKLTRTAAKLLPPTLFSRIAARASALTGLQGAHLPERAAPVYGMMAALPNRGDLNEIVMNLMEQWTEPDADDHGS